VSTHDLHDESSRVRRGGGRDRVDGFADSVKSGETSDGQIGHGHIVAAERIESTIARGRRSSERGYALNRSNKTNDVEVSVPLGLDLGDLAWKNKSGDQLL
jgi:hypothetical protein